MPTAPAVVCEGDACALERPAGDAKDPESGTDAAASNDVIVYSRWSCSLCWITKWALWWHGVRYVTRSIDYDRSWEDAIDRSGQFNDTVVVVFSDHGDYAGDYGLVEKWPSGLEDVLTRVPLYVRAPFLGAPRGSSRPDAADAAPRWRSSSSERRPWKKRQYHWNQP